MRRLRGGVGVCVCVCVCVCARARVCVYIRVYLYTYIHIYMHINTQTPHTYIHIFISAHTHTHTHTHTNTHHSYRRPKSGRKCHIRFAASRELTCSYAGATKDQLVLGPRNVRTCAGNRDFDCVGDRDVSQALLAPGCQARRSHRPVLTFSRFRELHSAFVNCSELGP